MYSLNAILIAQEKKGEIQKALIESNVYIESEFPTILSAISCLLSTPETDSRFFVVHLKSADELSHLAELKSTFDNIPIIVLLDPTSDRRPSISGIPRIVIDVMRAGVSQIVPLPLEFTDFTKAIDCLAIQCDFDNDDSHLIAISGVSGGCGATTVALNLSLELSSILGFQAILAEQNLQMGMLANFLPKPPRYSLDQLLQLQRIDMNQIREALCYFNQQLLLLSGPFSSLHASSDRAISKEDLCSRMTHLIEGLRRLASLVVLDISPTLDDLYFSSISQADSVVLVAEQTLPSLRRLQMVKETLESVYGIIPAKVVINKFNPKQFSLSVRELSGLLGVESISTLSHESAVRDACNLGVSLRDHDPGSIVLHELRELGKSLIGQEAPIEKSKHSFSQLLQFIGL